MFNFDGKVAVITGAASGIGEATATLFAELGASVVVADLNGEGAEKVASAITSTGGSALAVHADLEDETSIESMIQAAVDRFDGLDILDNNAALTEPSHFARDVGVVDMESSVWDRTFAVNVRGPMLACKYALPHMLKRGGGSIINIASMMGSGGDVIMSAYGTSKSASVGLTQYVASQHLKDGIRCNSVAPGLVLTPAARDLIPTALAEGFDRHQSHIGEPIEIARLVAFLASDWASLITGQLISADGGMFTHVPMLPERATFFATAG